MSSKYVPVLPMMFALSAVDSMKRIAMFGSGMFPLGALLMLAALLSSAYVAAGEAQVTDRSRGFLTPLDASLFLPPDHPRVRRACRNNERDTACPKFLRYGNDVAGPGPFIPPNLVGEYAPHLLVTFRFVDVTHVPIEGNGVNTNGIGFEFLVDSSVSDVESPLGISSTGVSEIPPNTSWTFNAVPWQAIVQNGCFSPPAVIPIDFENRIRAADEITGLTEELGVFNAVDNTSLVPTGFWNVRYTARATDDNGGVSDFRVRGTISVVCSTEPDFT